MKRLLKFMLGLLIIFSLTACNTQIEVTPTPITTAKPIHTRGTETKYEEETYIGNKNSKKFHRPDCWTLPSEENHVEFTSREDAVNSGYSPCGNCQP